MLRIMPSVTIFLLIFFFKAEDKAGQRSKIPQDICDWLMDCSGKIYVLFIFQLYFYIAQTLSDLDVTSLNQYRHN